MCFIGSIKDIYRHPTLQVVQYVGLGHFQCHSTVPSVLPQPCCSFVQKQISQPYIVFTKAIHMSQMVQGPCRDHMGYLLPSPHIQIRPLTACLWLHVLTTLQKHFQWLYKGLLYSFKTIQWCDLTQMSALLFNSCYVHTDISTCFMGL